MVSSLDVDQVRAVIDLADMRCRRSWRQWIIASEMIIVIKRGAWVGPVTLDTHCRLHSLSQSANVFLIFKLFSLKIHSFAHFHEF